MNKIFILFGSSGNLGSYAVNYFLKMDYKNFYFVSRKPINLDKGNLILINDILREEDVELVFNKINREQNNFYCLLNTIGGYWGGTEIAKTPLSQWQRMINLNLTTTFLIAKHFIDLCKTGLGGSFITISALSGINVEPNKAAYSISKCGINYLIKLLALENQSNKISFNAIAPYIIDSEENKMWIKNKSLLIPKENICMLAEDIFRNSGVVNGNIFELPYSNN